MMKPITAIKLQVTLACVYLTCLSANAMAQAEEGAWYVRAYTGLSQLSDTTANTQNVGSVDGTATIKVDSGFLTGMSVGYRHKPQLGLELTWEYRSNNSKTTIADTTTYNEGNYASNLFFLNGLYHFKAHNNWQPYVGAGIGWVQEIDLDLESANTEQSFSGSGNTALNLLAGVDYALTPDWSINSELRYADFGDIDLKGETNTGTIKGLEYKPLTLQLGVTYRF